MWSKFACFTRPECRAERLSYEFPTHGALRGFFRAILGKPEIDWTIESATIVQPGRWMTLYNNELKGFPKKAFAIEDQRTQRRTTLLRNVRYVAQARMYLTRPNEFGIAKYESMYERTVKRGYHAHRPYLGMKEFAAYFRPLLADDPTPDPDPITKPLGLVLYDSRYENGQSVAYYHEARVTNGVLQYPSWDEVLQYGRRTYARSASA